MEEDNKRETRSLRKVPCPSTLNVSLPKVHKINKNCILLFYSLMICEDFNLTFKKSPSLLPIFSLCKVNLTRLLRNFNAFPHFEKTVYTIWRDWYRGYLREICREKWWWIWLVCISSTLVFHELLILALLCCVQDACTRQFSSPDDKGLVFLTLSLPTPSLDFLFFEGEFTLLTMIVAVVAAVVVMF